MWKSLAVAVVVGAASPAFAEPESTPTPLVHPSFETLPGIDDETTAALWREARALDAADEPARAAIVYQDLAIRLPRAAAPRWMAARSHWNEALRLPSGDGEERRQAHRRTREWAEKGIEVSADCGECYLYAAAGLGGEVRQGGAVAGAIEVSEIASLLERGIAMMERRLDADRNHELGDLYFAAAQLYWRFPDSGLLRWALGVPGDRQRALGYMRRAYSLKGERPKYGVQLGALLLCVGSDENDPALRDEGERLLRMLEDPGSAADTRARSDAAVLLAQPGTACDFHQ
jgi:hypothetical protein